MTPCARLHREPAPTAGRLNAIAVAIASETNVLDSNWEEEIFESLWRHFVLHFSGDVAPTSNPPCVRYAHICECKRKRERKFGKATTVFIREFKKYSLR